MENEKLEIVQVPLNKLEYTMESIVLRTLRKYDRIRAIEKKSEDKLLPKNKAAKSLGICYNTLIKLIEKGSIKTTADGTKVLQSSIDAYFQRDM